MAMNANDKEYYRGCYGFIFKIKSQNARMLSTVVRACVDSIRPVPSLDASRLTRVTLQLHVQKRAM
jgi:hypothetical protein